MIYGKDEGSQAGVIDAKTGIIRDWSTGDLDVDYGRA
jgi:hypothetical protein